MGSTRGSQEPVRFLLADSDPVQRRALADIVKRAWPGTSHLLEADSLTNALLVLQTEPVDAVLADTDLAGMSSLDDLSQIAAAAPGSALIALSAKGSVSLAVETMRVGAHDFLIKPVHAAQLVDRLSKAMATCRLPSSTTAQSGHADTDTKLRSDFEGFIGTSPAMQGIYDQIRRIAPSRAPVFITGESGTGKEVCAEAIHRRSGCAGAQFIAINCGAIPKDLMESEIFGHIRGAFTGATEDRAGAAELADGGTLFLDEIGELDLALQAKLLRFIQTGTVQRVGETRPRRVDVRFVCATNRDPLAEVQAGRFREDLFYRLHVLPIHLPPLRARRDDVLGLAKCFLQRYASEENRRFRGFTSDVEYILRTYDWPGNVRQLQNVLRRVIVMHDGEYVSQDMLPAQIGAAASLEHAPVSQPFLAPQSPSALPVSSAMPHGSPAVDLRSRSSVAPFWQQEQQIIEGALEAFGGNIARAAAALEISPSTIYRKKQSWSNRLDIN